MNDLEEFNSDRTEFFFELLWDCKRFLVAAITVSALASLVTALLLPNVYEARVLLAPKDDDGAGGLSRLAAQYGGLASLAGIDISSIGNEGLPKAKLAMERMRSLTFFESQIYEEVVVELMAFDSWNLDKQQGSIDPDIFDEKKGVWVREFRPPYKLKPSAQETHEKFLKEALIINENDESGLVSVIVEHKSPVLAKRWVELLVNRASEEIRAQDIDEARRAIEFLEALRDQNSIVVLDDVFAQLIEEKTKTILLAEVSENYVFDIIEEAVVPEFKVRPRRALICIFGTLIGGILAVFLVLAVPPGSKLSKLISV